MGYGYALEGADHLLFLLTLLLVAPLIPSAGPAPSDWCNGLAFAGILADLALEGSTSLPELSPVA